jgi:hypothetical protein
MNGQEKARLTPGSSSIQSPIVAHNTPPSRRVWLQQAASTVRWLRKDSKPSPDEQDERYAEDRLWEAANTASAATEIVPRQLLVIVEVSRDTQDGLFVKGGSVRILGEDVRAFIVELPEGGAR